MFTWFESPLIKIGLWLAAALALACGVLYGLHAIDARGYQRAQSECHAAEAAAKIAADKIEQDKVDAQNRHLLRLSEQLITAKADIDALNKRLQEKTHEVSTQFRPQPGAALQPVPAWTVTRGWLCNYNRAIGYDGMQGTATAAGGDTATSCASDPFAASSVTAEQILRHHDDYGAYCQKLERQVNALLDAYEAIEQRAQKDAGQ